MSVRDLLPPRPCKKKKVYCCLQPCMYACLCLPDMVTHKFTRMCCMISHALLHNSELQTPPLLYFMLLFRFYVQLITMIAKHGYVKFGLPLDCLNVIQEALTKLTVNLFFHELENSSCCSGHWMFRSHYSLGDRVVFVFKRSG